MMTDIEMLEMNRNRAGAMGVVLFTGVSCFGITKALMDKNDLFTPHQIFTDPVASIILGYAGIASLFLIGAASYMSKSLQNSPDDQVLKKSEICLTTAGLFLTISTIMLLVTPNTNTNEYYGIGARIMLAIPTIFAAFCSWKLMPPAEKNDSGPKLTL